MDLYISKPVESEDLKDEVISPVVDEIVQELRWVWEKLDGILQVLP